VAVRWLLRQLPLDAFDVLWQRTLGTDAGKPQVLERPLPASPYSRMSMQRSAADYLDRIGCLPGSAWARDVSFTLLALADPVHAYDLRWESDRPFRAIAAQRDASHVLAMVVPPNLDGGACLWLGTVEAGYLAPALVGLLPEREAAELESQSVPVTAVAGADAGLRGQNDDEVVADRPFAVVDTELRRQGISEEASAAFALLAAERSLGRGEFGVSTRVTGLRLRGRTRLVVNDTRLGRYAIMSRGDYVTVLGASTELLIDDLRRQHHELLRS
jgi:hypothetical protein